MKCKGESESPAQYYCYSVPSSILLCGEYLITEEYGKGICLGIEPRSYLHVNRHLNEETMTGESFLHITCHYADKSIIFLQPMDFDFWSIAQQIATEVYSRFAINNTMLQDVFTEHAMQKYRVELCIDTSLLYDTKSKQKLGLGSSASCAILTCASYILLTGYDPTQNLALLRYFASQVHYLWQQKKGSGYELYASVYGGALLLQNQKSQKKRLYCTYSSISFPEQYSWGYWHNKQSVSSRSALLKYQQWKEQHPKEQKSLMEEILLAISIFAQCRSENDYCFWLRRMNLLGKILGTAIGQSATISIVPSAVLAYKSCGAGNEQGVGILRNIEVQKETTQSHSNDKDSKDKNPVQVHALSIAAGFRLENITEKALEKHPLHIPNDR